MILPVAGVGREGFRRHSTTPGTRAVVGKQEGMEGDPFLPTVPVFAVRETDVSRHNGGASGAPLKPLRDDSALNVASQ